METKIVPVAEAAPGRADAPKERGILFSAPMVRALMREQNPKTQTRRIMKVQPAVKPMPVYGRIDARLAALAPEIRCPYGQPGDRLWVRETWQPLWAKANKAPADFKSPDGWEIGYVATDGIQEYNDPDDNLTTRCKPAIHMPRWASRLTLEVTDIRVERLQDITEADAIAEGATFTDFGKDRWGNQLPGWTMEPPPASSGVCLGTARFAFANLINKINGPETWDSNPWVWVVEFRKARSAPEAASAGGTQP